jgi:ABC-2 type transport system ATP-binding protein
MNVVGGTPVVEARGLWFAYRGRVAVRDVSLVLEPGLYSLVGSNGAGKSTLLKVLTGQARPKAGQLVVDGDPVSTARARSRWRARVGFLPQAPVWSVPMAAASFLAYFAGLRGLERRAATARARECLEMVGLADAAKARLNELSGGQLRRLFIAQSLVHDPPFLVLDEPTAGLDPAARVELRELVSQTRAGRVVVMATHLIEDVTLLSGRVLVVQGGEVIWSGTAGELGAMTRSSGDGPNRLGSAEEIGFIELFSRQGGQSR